MAWLGRYLVKRLAWWALLGGITLLLGLMGTASTARASCYSDPPAAESPDVSCAPPVVVQLSEADRARLDALASQGVGLSAQADALTGLADDGLVIVSAGLGLVIVVGTVTAVASGLRRR